VEGGLPPSPASPVAIAVPNVSEGRDPAAIAALADACRVPGARVVDVHSDPDHHRSVLTVVGEPLALQDAMVALAGECIDRIDLRRHRGAHPRVGALDVVPLVALEQEDVPLASEIATGLAARLGGELNLPVFLYGELATSPDRAERSWLRRGGPEELARRMDSGELAPDYGPARAHPSAGAVLAAARPPLVAFNVDLATDDVELARAIAAELRESDGGLPGVRALGLYLDGRGCAQVSTNVQDHRAVSLREIVERVRVRAPVAGAELIGLAPRAAFEGFPDDVPLRGFSPERHILEEALAALR
jgi:glutamate formiminotransferase / 5-formyltetrahydrofolate cyclo-ligase